MSDDILWRFLCLCVCVCVVFCLSLKPVALFRYYLIGILLWTVKERFSSQQCPSDMVSMLPDFRKPLQSQCSEHFTNIQMPCDARSVTLVCVLFSWWLFWKVCAGFPWSFSDSVVWQDILIMWRNSRECSRELKVKVANPVSSQDKEGVPCRHFSTHWA